MHTFSTTQDLLGARGQSLGPSRWRTVSQAQVDAFADTVDDHQWIHVDTQRSAAGPYGTTIAHGMLTVSLVPTMVGELASVERSTFGLNYGFNRVRFLKPVPVGSRLRATVQIVETTKVDGGVRAVFRASVELEGSDTPVCVADNVIVFYG